MALVNAQDVLRAMAVPSDPGTLQNATQAIDISLPILETLLESKLEQGSVVDYFDYYGPVGAATKMPAALRLKNRYIDGPVVVRYSTDQSPLLTMTQGTVMDPSLYAVDKSSGILYIYKPPVKGGSVYSAFYDYGFGDPEDTPSHIKQLAIDAAICVLNSLPSNPNSRKQSTAHSVANTVFKMMQAKALPYHRPRLTVDFYSRSEDV